MSIFEDEKKADQPTEEAPKEETPQEQESVSPKHEASDFGNMLEGITNNEGKPKYSSVEQALGSIPHAQKHINQLETDNQQMKDELASLTDEVQKYKDQVERQMSVEELLNKKDKQDFSPEQLDEYLEQKLSAREQAAKSQQNVTSVANSLVELYGDRASAEKEFLALQQELGIDLAELSAKSPKAVLRYFNKPENKAPDKFQGKSPKPFEREAPTKPRMPRTTKESVANWRTSADNIRQKYGIE